MQYRPVPIYDYKQVVRNVFDDEITLDDKTLHILSAIYHFEVETAGMLLIRVLGTDDFALKLGAVRLLETYMQSRGTNFGFKIYMNVIKELRLHDPNLSSEMDEIAENIAEFNTMFS